MSNKADLYIMLPCIKIKNEKDISQEKKYNDNELFDIKTSEYRTRKNGNFFIKALSNVSQVEFDSVLSTGIKRNFLCKINLLCYMDERRNNAFIDYQDAFIVKSQYKDTDFCLLTIAMINVKDNLITFILDQASRGELLIFEENKNTLLYDWILKFGLKSTGKAFFALYTSELPNTDLEAPFILAAEAFYNEENYRIISDKIKKSLNTNHAQYSYYDAYMSERGIINVRNFDKSYEVRIKDESKMIFIMELITLKITAINIANDRVIEEYSNKEASSESILKILEDFAKSLPMWDMQHFKYFIAQEFANKVESSFKVSRYLAAYEKSRKQLEQIINIRKFNASEIERKTITIFGTILAISQITPLLSPLVLRLLGFAEKRLEQDLTPLIIFVVIAIISIFFIFKNKKHT